jgi:hypothetical protein
MAITSVNNSVCLQSVVDMFGVDPLKFNGLWPTCIEYNDQGCEDFWTQFYEKGSITSRQELANELYRAELEVAAYLGQFPFTTYICNEHLDIESCYRNRNAMGVDLTQYQFKTEWDCVQEFGVFEDVTLGEASVVISDEDGDGYKETGTITFDYNAVLVDFDVDDLMLLFQGFDDYNNVVCPIISISNDTDAKIITFIVDSWNLVHPELYVHRSFVETNAIEACDDDNYVDTLDVSIKVKTCAPDGWVYYKDNNCTGDCDEAAYPFCASRAEKRLGYFQISVGSVDDTGCFIESSVSCLPSRKPSRIEINYKTGCTACLSTAKDISFCTLIERAIIYLAITRMPRTLCDCGCSTKLVEELKYDTSISYANSGIKFNYPMWQRINNPFGTKIGEIEAFKILRTLEDNLC